MSSRRIRIPRIEERKPPPTTPIRPPSGPKSLIDWVLVFTGIAWAQEVRRHAARRVRSRWDRARDAWVVASIVLAWPIAWLLGHVVLRIEQEAIAEGVVFRPPSRQAAGTEAGAAGAIEVIAGFVGPDATAPTAKGTVLATFLIERSIDLGGWPFASRRRANTPTLLIFDHAAGIDTAIENPQGHRHLAHIADALERLAAEEEEASGGNDAVSAAVEAVVGLNAPDEASPRARFETQRSSLLANTMIAGSAAMLAGSIAISLVQFLSWFVRGSAERRRERLRRKGRCPKCGHDVRANVLSAQCPECGELLY
ncbi:MAG: hypothetical protein ACO3Y3_10665 [Phycisphaerales bacterium]